MEVRPVQAAAHPRRNPWWIWLMLSILIAVLLYLVARYVTLAERTLARDYYLPADKFALVSLAAGFCLAMPFACLWVNRRMWRSMVRWTKGKVAAAVLVAGFAPVVMFGVFPGALGLGAFASVIAVLVQPLKGESWIAFALGQTAMILAFAMAYPLTGAVIYGLPKRWRPVALVLFVIGLDLLFPLFGSPIKPVL